MGGVVHTVTDAVGLTDYAGQKRQEEAANRAADRSYGLTEDQLAFQRSQYEDWKGVYGDIQTNLGNYYNNLSSSNWEAQNYEAIQQQYQKALGQVRQVLAQRGLDDSGVEAKAEIGFAEKMAQQKATVQANADQYVADKKMNFLGLGLGQGTQMLGINAQVANAGAGAQANISGAHTAAMAGLGSANIGSIGGVIGSVAGAATASAMLK